MPLPTSTLIGISEGQRLSLVGSASIWVVKGQCQVLGLALSPGPGLSIDSSSPLSFSSAVTTQYKSFPITPPLLPPLDVSPDQHKIDELGTPTVLFVSQHAPHPALRMVAGVTITNPIIPGLAVANSAWDSSLETISLPANQSSDIIVVCGPQGVGKSTMCRILVNHLLSVHSRVRYLDTDPGQPELWAPGTLSLHELSLPIVGGISTHRTPLLSFFLGDTSPAGDPARWCASVGRLVQHHHTLDACPLVVNTHGWVKGLGYELLAALLVAVSPQLVITMGFGDSDGGAPLVDRASIQAAAQTGGGADGRWVRAATNSSTDSYNPQQILHVACSPHQREPSGTLLRRANLVSYLCGDTAPQQWPVYRVPWSAIRLACNAEPTHAMVALNASVVGLVHDSRQLVPAQGGICDPDSPQFVQEAPIAPCIGLGVVRAVDMEGKSLLLCTPEYVSRLALVNMIVESHIDLPICLLLQSGEADVPYVASSQLTSVIGSGPMRSRGV